MNSQDKFSNLQHTGIRWWRYLIRGSAMLVVGVTLILLTIFKPDGLAVSKQARGLTVLEAIVGQLYLAVMVSRLVSLHISKSRY